MEPVFTNIYEKFIWGNNHNPKYNGSSGQGSNIEYNSHTYVPFLKRFIQEKNIQTVVDLGCGDFKCGPSIYDDLEITYTGYDVYSKIIDFHNTASYAHNKKYTFIHSDFYNEKESLIPADLCILKDVLQHWSLEHIYTFLDSIVEQRKYKYILIINCCDQRQDNTNIVNGGCRGLSSYFLPLKKYHPISLYRYHTKEVCLITL